MGKRNKNKQNVAERDGGASSKQLELNRYLQQLAFVSSHIYIDEKNVSATFDKVKQLLSQIVKLEADLGAGALELFNNARSCNFLPLFEWVNKNGGKVEGLNVFDYVHEGFGLQSNQDFNEGDLICSIPRKVMLTAEAKASDSVFSLIRQDPVLRHMPNVALALVLLSEYAKGASSFWYPYIASLPRSYTTILYWTQEQVSLLKGSPAQDAAMLNNIHIARQYTYIHHILGKSTDSEYQELKKIFSYQLYRWAVSTVLTRQNMIPSLDNADETTAALIPVWDMCNHRPGSITTGFNIENQCSECFAPSSFKKGEQILISYGSRPNSEYLIHNGFVPDENPDDKYRIHLGLTRSDPLLSRRTNLLKTLGLPAGGDFYLAYGAQPVTPDLLAFIRVFSMGEESLNEWENSNKCEDLKFIDCSLCMKTEIKAWKFLLGRVSLLLSVYPKIPDSNKNDRVKLILKQVESEKNLLQAARDYATLRAEH